MRQAHPTRATEGGRGDTALSLVARVAYWTLVASFVYALVVAQPSAAGGGGVGSCSNGELIETIPTANPDELHFIVTGPATWAYGLDDSDFADAVMSGLTSDFDVVTAGETVYVFCDVGDSYTYEWSLDSEVVAACFDDLSCDDNDVVAGLSQLSVQLHGLAGFLFVVSGFFAFTAVIGVALLFVELRRA